MYFDDAARCVGCTKEHVQNEEEEKNSTNFRLYCIHYVYATRTDIDGTLAVDKFQVSGKSHHHTGIKRFYCCRRAKMGQENKMKTTPSICSSPQVPVPGIDTGCMCRRRHHHQHHFAIFPVTARHGAFPVNLSSPEYHGKPF